MLAVLLGDAGGRPRHADRHTRPRRLGALLRHAADDRAAGDGARLAATVRPGQPIPQAVRRSAAARHATIRFIRRRASSCCSACSTARWSSCWCAPACASCRASWSRRRAAGGAGWFTVLVTIVLPLMTPSIMAAAALAFVSCVGNFGIPAFLGIPANYLVLPTLDLSAAGRRRSGRARRGRVPVGADRRHRHGRHSRPGRR